MEPYWAFVVIYLTGGWVGGLITQAIFDEVIAHRDRKRSAEWAREISSAREAMRRTSLDRAARTPTPASSA
jgi:hypothetical protein